VALTTIAVLTAVGAFLATPSIGVQIVVLVVGVLTVGMPHGAMDHRVAEMCIGSRLARWGGRGELWRPVFAVGYLGLAGLVIGVWWVAPQVMLVVFLGYSVVHFGLGDQPGARLDRVLAHGLLPILLPLCFHPSETAYLLGLVAGIPVSVDPWLLAIRLTTAAAVAVAIIHSVVHRATWPAVEVVVLIAANVVFAPLLAFGLYFVLLHSTRHLIELADWLEPEAPVRGLRRIVRECLPLTLVTCALMGVGFAWIHPQSVESGVMRVLFVTLSALTVPHMLLTELASHDRGGGRNQRGGSSTGGAAL
jgi:Brp/Blh family beta-carotene 15,15'-monooxygenase